MVREGVQMIQTCDSDDPDACYDHLACATKFSDKLSESERLLDEDNKMDEAYKTFLLEILAKEKVALSKKKQREKDEDRDAYGDLIHTEFDNELSEYERLLQENKKVDADYKTFLLNLLAKEKRLKSNKKRREKDEEDDNNFYDDEENDPEYELVLKCLKEHEKSYVIEDERNGSRVVIRLEGDSSSDEESDLERRRKLRSTPEQKGGPANQIPGAENHRKHDSRSIPTKVTEKQTWRQSRKYEGDSSSDDEFETEWRRRLRSAMKQKGGPSKQIPGTENRQKHYSQSIPTKVAKKRSWRQSKKYEGDSSSDEEFEPDPRRKLRSATKLKSGRPNQIPGAENRQKHYSQSIPIKVAEKWAWRQSRKYEGDSSPDEEFEPDPRRKLSAAKLKSGPSNQMPGVDNQQEHGSQYIPTKETEKLNWGKSRNKSKSEKEENIRLSINKVMPDPDYLTFMRTLKVVDDHYVYKYGDHTVVYELKVEQNNHEKEEPHDGYYSDVEILDSTFYKEGNLNSPTMNNGSNSKPEDTTLQYEYRRKVLTVLRKPYDEMEHDKLWQDIELRKPEGRHVELRNGRERSCFTQKEGRSYLDHCPELHWKLLQVKHDKPKCLNLLRGFFFWLEHPSSFRPWQDAECLATYPDRADPGSSRHFL